MSEVEREDFERKLRDLYDSHGGDAIFKESAERQHEIMQALEQETDQLSKLGLQSEFRKRRLSYTLALRSKDQLQQELQRRTTRRPSLEWRSPPLTGEPKTKPLANRRHKVQPPSDAAAPADAEAGATEPPFDSATLGTFSHHGIEPKYYGEGFTAKINQDRGCVVHPYGSAETQSLFCVFDGHGERGEDVSEFVLENIVSTLENDADLATDPAKALISTFLKTDELLAKSNIDSFFSGTTAVVIFRNGNDVYTANVGDSRAIIARRDSTTAQLAPQALSIDQNPDTPGERERIEAAGGFVSEPPGEGLSARVWLDKNMTRVGLAMARSIGDNAVKNVGVIAEPEVREPLVSSDAASGTQTHHRQRRRVLDHGLGRASSPMSLADCVAGGMGVHLERGSH